MSDEAQTNWQIYPSLLEGTFALFVVDLDVKGRAPIPELPWLHHVVSHYESRRPDGMPVPEQMAELDDIEEWLIEFFDDPPGLLVGRITLAGRREWFVYGTEDRTDEFRGGFELKFPDGEYEILAKPDPEWIVYRDVLYPTKRDIQRIKNQQAVRALIENGDDPEIPRPVDHFAYFPDASSKEEFRRHLRGEGFEIVTSDVDEEREEKPHRIVFRKTHAVALGSIDSVVMPLLKEIEKLDGRYDGWGCPVAG